MIPLKVKKMMKLGFSHVALVCLILFFLKGTHSKISIGGISMNSITDVIDEIIPNYEEELSPEYCVCGEEDVPLSSRIVGGEEVDVPGKYPWVVAIAQKTGLATYSMFCGGALIGDKFVLTAAHCLINEDVSRLRVIAGIHKLPPILPPSFLVKNYTLHPDYDNENVVNDIALIELEKSVQFTDFVRPICLPTQKDFPPSTEAVGAGWGNMRQKGNNPNKASIFLEAEILYEIRKVMKPHRMNAFFVIDKFFEIKEEKNKLSTTLREVTLPIVPNPECNILFKNNTDIIDGNICAGEVGKDTCQGDSGGPLFTKYKDRWYTIGVVSWGFGCASDTPGVYSRVSYYLDWIRNETRHAPPCRPPE